MNKAIYFEPGLYGCLPSIILCNCAAPLMVFNLHVQSIEADAF